RSHPSVPPIESSDCRSSLRVVWIADDCGPLIWRFREDLNLTAAAKAAERLTGSRCGKARHAREPLGSAERLKIFVEDVVGRRLTWSRAGDDVVWLENRSTVDRIDSRHDDRDIAAAMTRPARDDLPSAKMLPVDRRNHQRHPARRPFFRRVDVPRDA